MNNLVKTLYVLIINYDKNINNLYKSIISNPDHQKNTIDVSSYDIKIFIKRYKYGSYS